MRAKITKREFQIASIAHATILIGYVFLFAFIFPFLIWFKEIKSRFIKSQAKQAAIYQILILLIIVIIGPIVAFLISQYQQPKTQEICIGEEILTCMLLPQTVDLRTLTKNVRLAMYTIFSLYALYGAYRVNKGKNFRYFLIGNVS